MSTALVPTKTTAITGACEGVWKSENGGDVGRRRP